MGKSRLVGDLEANALLNSTSVDYNASPYKLKPDFKIHCIGFVDVDSDKEYTFVGDEIKRVKEFVLDTADELIFHNPIFYDYRVMMAALDMPFDIGGNEANRIITSHFYDRQVDLLCGRPFTLTDTLVMSKCLNPDRQAHSIDYFGSIIGLPKIDWRAKAIEVGLIDANAPKGAEFATYHPAMLEYMMRDIGVGIKVWKFLLREWGDWNWKAAYELEKQVADVVARQEHRGFWFNEELAVENVRDLDIKMANLKEIVEPLIPPKPLTKTAAKDYIPPKLQFKKNGEVSALMHKWVEKHEGSLWEESGIWWAEVLGKTYKLPIPLEPILTHMPATIRDTTHIKGWLIELGWEPSAYKERDLTVDYKKKKLSMEDYIAACDRYIEQTLSSPFMRDRMEHLEVSDEITFRSKLYKHDFMKRPLKVLTNPTLTVGVDREIDPALLAMQDKFAHAKDISDYLTYSHRRNSILGGGFDPDDLDDEDEYATKGWLSVDRIKQDHRIQTPADTCGAGTSRFKHRVVVNVPRVTSLYGHEMRSLFGVDLKDGFIQMGYDFDSLEARIEAHYTWKYDTEEGKPYCNSLIREKPFDIHTITANKISEMIGQPFARGPSKNVKYGCSYGARPARVAKTVGCSLELGEKIFNAFWEAAKPLALLQDRLKQYWEESGGRKFILGLDGRKIPTRSASALINSLFQSAGVICAKRAMVLHDRLLKAEGLLVDFWRDDWRNSDFCQQLIAMHDECQLEVRRSQVKWKLFQTEEEAKAFKAENPNWSDVGHSDKGYYVGYCRAGELAKEAVKQASEYYKLNVELTAGYMLGKNWADCH